MTLSKLVINNGRLTPYLVKGFTGISVTRMKANAFKHVQVVGFSAHVKD